MIIVANKTGEVDSAYHSLVKHINSKYPIVMVSWSENFVFNDALLGLKDYVLICFCEYGWDFKIIDTHIWGKNSEQFKRYYQSDWIKFDNWVKENPPKILFKRELLKKDVSETVKPIEYPCILPICNIQTRGEFNNRPINVFQYWGRSNENRIRIHGEIWKHAFEKGFQPCDNIYYINNYLAEEKGEKWITLWMPHWARVEMSNLLVFNGGSKLSLSWSGAGFKCFRTMESPVNSVMVMHNNNFSWSFDWDETNCILSDNGTEIETIELALKNENLYDIYVNGMLNVNKYRLENYLPHIEKLINER